MGVAHHLAEIGNAAYVPEQAHGIRPGCPGGDAGVLGQAIEGQFVVGLTGLHQARHARPLGQAGPQGGQGCESQFRVAPLERIEGGEAVVLDAVDGLGIEGAGVGGGAEGAVVHVAPGAARDLGQFDGRECARRVAVELARLGEGHVIDVHVEAHADGVGGDQIVDLAGLIHSHLGVARARAERPQHHRGAATLAAHQFGEGVNVGGGKRDHGAARRQAGYLALAGIGQVRKARAGDELGLRHQTAEHGLHRLGAH